MRRLHRLRGSGVAPWLRTASARTRGENHTHGPTHTAQEDTLTRQVGNQCAPLVSHDKGVSAAAKLVSSMLLQSANALQESTLQA